MPSRVTIPLVNPNEPEALLATLLIQEGQPVQSGDLLCTLETTKSTADVHAETNGYVTGLHVSAGQVVRAGDILCYLAESADWTPPEAAEPTQPASQPIHQQALPPGLRITDPALAFARQHQVDLSQLPTGTLVTEAVVRDLLARTPPGAPGPVASIGTAALADRFAIPASPFDPTAILIYGGGGHGKMVIDLLRASGGYHIAGIIDDGRTPGDLVMGVGVLGGSDLLAEFHARGIRLAVNAVGGIGNIQTRIKVFERLAQAGFACPALVHPTAYIDPSARLSPGAQVFVHAYVGPDTQIGYGCILNTGSIISHDCRLGNYVNVSPGAILAGEVEAGSGALLGMGVTVNLGVKIGPGARIGNSATVKADVPAGGVVRAGSIWPA